MNEILQLLTVFICGLTSGLMLSDYLYTEPMRKLLKESNRYWGESLQMNAKLLKENIDLKLPQKSPIQL